MRRSLCVASLVLVLLAVLGYFLWQREAALRPPSAISAVEAAAPQQVEPESALEHTRQPVRAAADAPAEAPLAPAVAPDLMAEFLAIRELEGAWECIERWAQCGPALQPSLVELLARRGEVDSQEHRELLDRVVFEVVVRTSGADALLLALDSEQAAALSRPLCAWLAQESSAAALARASTQAPGGGLKLQAPAGSCPALALALFGSKEAMEQSIRGLVPPEAHSNDLGIDAFGVVRLGLGCGTGAANDALRRLVQLEMPGNGDPKDALANDWRVRDGLVALAAAAPQDAVASLLREALHSSSRQSLQRASDLLRGIARGPGSGSHGPLGALLVETAEQRSDLFAEAAAAWFHLAADEPALDLDLCASLALAADRHNLEFELPLSKLEPADALGLLLQCLAHPKESGYESELEACQSLEAYLALRIAKRFQLPPLAEELAPVDAARLAQLQSLYESLPDWSEFPVYAGIVRAAGGAYLRSLAGEQRIDIWQNYLDGLLQPATTIQAIPALESQMAMLAFKRLIAPLMPAESLDLGLFAANAEFMLARYTSFLVPILERFDGAPRAILQGQFETLRQIASEHESGKARELALVLCLQAADSEKQIEDLLDNVVRPEDEYLVRASAKGLPRLLSEGTVGIDLVTHWIERTARTGSRDSVEELLDQLEDSVPKSLTRRSDLTAIQAVLLSVLETLQERKARQDVERALRRIQTCLEQAD